MWESNLHHFYVFEIAVSNTTPFPSTRKMFVWGNFETSDMVSKSNGFFFELLSRWRSIWNSFATSDNRLRLMESTGSLLMRLSTLSSQSHIAIRTFEIQRITQPTASNSHFYILFRNRHVGCIQLKKLFYWMPNWTVWRLLSYSLGTVSDSGTVGTCPSRQGLQCLLKKIKK